MKRITEIVLLIILMVSLSGCMSEESKDSKIFEKCDEEDYAGSIELLEKYYGEKAEDKSKYDEVSDRLGDIFVDAINEHVEKKAFDQAIAIIKDAGPYLNAARTRTSAEAIIMSKFETIFDSYSPNTAVQDLKELEEYIDEAELSYYKESVLEDVTGGIVAAYVGNEDYRAASKVMNEYYDYVSDWDRDTYDDDIVDGISQSEEYVNLYFDSGFDAWVEKIQSEFPQKRHAERVAEAINDIYYYDQVQYVTITSIDVEYPDYASDYATFKCWITNNSGLTIDSSNIELRLYDANGNFIEDREVYSYETCVPGETFVEDSWVEVPYNIASYEFVILDVDFQ